jgi:hypothetical protein
MLFEDERSMTNEECVRLLYRHILGRDADPDDLMAWTALADREGKINGVFEGIIKNSESAARAAPSGKEYPTGDTALAPSAEKERIAELEQLVRYQPFGRDAGIRSLESKVDQLRTMVLDKDREIEYLKNSLERARTENANLCSECGRKALEIAALQASMSWRVTGPLRWVRRLLWR